MKERAFRRAFTRFHEIEWCRDGDRAGRFRAFLGAQAWWIEDYALFRAIHRHQGERPWPEWPAPLQAREPVAIDRIRRELSSEVLFHQFLQWVADEQWQQARRDAHGVSIFGDLPFMVDGDSADVWSRQDQFRLDASVGVPPDAFSATGQDWGMPAYRWDVIAAQDFRWLRERARRSADLFDGYRIDHLVGFYRTYARPRGGGVGFFSPSEERDQAALGERLLGLFRATGAEIIAEDLGTVPDFVRASLARLGVPGFKVLRWERYWHRAGQPFRDPMDYPQQSVATSGTHDTEPLLVWWERASAEEREKVGAMPTVQRLTGGAGLADADPCRVRDVLIEALYASPSTLALMPVQDVFGSRDRINEPATVTGANWTFRLPWAIDRFDEAPEVRERQQMLRRWAEQYDRV